MQCEATIVCRNDFLLISGAIAVVGGLLFPLPTHILDVLLIFTVSLTAGTLIITFSAQGALQVQSFPLFIVLVTTLRMALSITCAKLILVQGNGGTIVNLLARLIVGGNLMLTICVFGLLTAVIFAVVCKAVTDINHTGTEFISDIVPVRQVVINSDFHVGAIDRSQVSALRAKIVREVGFFVAMGGVAKFLLCDAVIEVLVIAVTVGASIAMGIAAAASKEISAKIYTPLSVAAGIVTQLSVLIVAVACDYLVRKSSVPIASDAPFPECRRGGNERIKVAASEVMSPRKTKPQHSKSGIAIDNIAVVESTFTASKLGEINNATELIGTDSDKEAVAEDLELADESQDINSHSRQEERSFWVSREINDSRSYEMIAELIESNSGERVKKILMAAGSVAELPVTIPVNVAMRLAQANKRCLLVDLDFERHAISKVFDVDNLNPGDNLQAKAIATCVNSLWVWPASSFCKLDESFETVLPDGVIRALENQYDYLLMYAPNMRSLPHWEQVTNSIHAAMLFGNASTEVEASCIRNLHRLMMAYDCKVIKPAEVFAQAV